VPTAARCTGFIENGLLSVLPSGLAAMALLPGSPRDGVDKGTRR